MSTPNPLDENLYDSMDSPTMGLAMGLLSAGGPSRMPVSLGQALSSALQTAQQYHPDGLGRALLQGSDPGTSVPVPPPSTGASNPSGIPDSMLLHQAMTAFGETGGVYPQMAPGKAGIYNPASYDPNSASQLQLARSWMARVRLANLSVTEKAPPTSNPIERRAWQGALDAAAAAKGVDMPAGVTHFYLRQGPMPDSAPSWAQGKPIKTFGPFINTGGGDVPKGPNMYIDFFGGK